MTASKGSDDRVVLPRWRPWRTTEYQRELDSLPIGPPVIDQVTTGEEAETELLNRVEDYDQWHGMHHAADLIGTAAVLGLGSHARVQEAAKRVLSSESPSARALAKRILSGSQPHDAEDLALAPASREALQPWLVKQKLIVRAQPRNVLAWADLALAHTNLGQSNAAEHAIRVALAQAKGNRFILRAAARFYIHRDDFERAHSVLTVDTDRLRSDPWLLAAEIAIADSSAQPQRHAAFARHLLDSGFAPHDLSELASALATIDLKHGKVKQARKLLSKALVDPTDNSLAQAEWSVPRGLDLVEEEKFDTPFSYEAKARHHFRNEEFAEALKYSELWLADQPFALDSAAFTSFVAATFVDDQKSAIRACEIGLVTNRHSALLLNNLAFSLAVSGQLDKAREVIRRPMVDVSQRDNAIVTATRGLIEFRSGDPSSGRELYRQAARALVKEKEDVAATSAALFWLYEELWAGQEDGVREALGFFEATRKRVSKSAEIALPRLRVRRLAEKVDSPLIKAISE
jgi:Flp pilus assembly protein TadD